MLHFLQNAKSDAAGRRDGQALLSSHMIAQPWDRLLEVELIGFVEGHDKSVCRPRIRRKAHAVDGEKGVHSGESGPLVALDKGMGLSRALPQRGGFLN